MRSRSGQNEDKDSNEEDKADWEEGGSEEPEEPSEDVAPLPYRSAAEFGFTAEATARYIGFRCLVDMELFPLVLQLNIVGTNQKVVAQVLCMCILEYENEYHLHIDKNIRTPDYMPIYIIHSTF